MDILLDFINGQFFCKLLSYLPVVVFFLAKFLYVKVAHFLGMVQLKGYSVQFITFSRERFLKIKN